MSTLVIGYGNITRSDDGVGVLIAQRIEQAFLPGVEVRTLQQLHVELAEEFLNYERVILIDASSDGEEVRLRRVEGGAGVTGSSSHHLGPEMLAGLATRLYGKEPVLFVCTVRAENFDFGQELTPSVRERAAEALRRILSLLQEESLHA